MTPTQEAIRAAVGSGTEGAGEMAVADLNISLTQEEAAFVLNELHCAGHGQGSSKDDFESECPSCTATDKIAVALANGVGGSDGR